MPGRWFRCSCLSHPEIVVCGVAEEAGVPGEAEEKTHEASPEAARVVRRERLIENLEQESHEYSMRQKKGAEDLPEELAFELQVLKRRLILLVDHCWCLSRLVATRSIGRNGPGRVHKLRQVPCRSKC